MTAFFGVDPGLSGALALLSDGNLHVWDMPTLTIEKAGKIRRELDLQGLLVIIRFAVDCDAQAIVEQVGVRPGEGAVGAFTFGKGYGAILALLAACEVPVSHVPPAVWKKALGVSADKDAARRRASELLPVHSSLWPLKKHDGRAEAALIAEYGRRKF